MFTTTPHRPQSYHQHQYQTQNQHYAPSPLSSSPLAASPSPLSQRCENLPTYTTYNHEKDHHERERIMSSPTPVPTSAKSNHTTTSTSSSIFTPAQLSSSNVFTPNTSVSGSSGSKYSKRHTKHNPLMHGSKEDGRETRRKLFLKRVREGSEEKRWQNRGGEEEIMRVLWCGEERRRLEGLRAEGRGIEFGFEGEMSLEDGDVEGGEVVDEVARLEEEEMMYLRALEEEVVQQGGLGDGFAMQQQQEFANAGFGGQQQLQYAQQQQQQDRPMSIYGSDDEEYDDIFQDVIEEEIRLSQQTQHSQQTQQEAGNHQDQDQDMMDLS